MFIGETSRECGTCHETKPYSRFSPRGKRGDIVLYKSVCKQCAATRARKWAKDNPERNRENSLNWQLRNVYGIEPERYYELLDRQGGVCAVCGKDELSAHGRTGTRFRLSVDHCHVTGRVRGLLCQSCNRAIGLLGDNIGILEKAIDYLKGDEPN